MMYQRWTPRISSPIATLAAMAMIVISPVASAADPGATLIFSYPNGFAGASGAIRTAWEAAYAGSALNLTPLPTQHQAGEAWYTTQQDITSFTTDFTFQLAVGDANGTSIQGITFCVQNSNSSTNPNSGSSGSGTNAGGDSNLMGYGAYSFQTGQAIGNSVAVKFDLSGANAQNNYPSGRIPNATGLYINGGPAGGLVPDIDLNPSGINLHRGDLMAVHIVYDGTILTMTLRDTATNAQVRQSWPVNIPLITGSNSAWIGFTGGTIPAVSQKILTWSFSTGYAPRLAAPTFNVAPGSYSSSQSVSLSAPSGSTIYYTTNGQQPTSSSSRYTGPISVSSSEVVQAVAIQSGFTDSLVAVANYQIAPAGTPIIDFPNGFGNASNLVTANGAAEYSGPAIHLTDLTNMLEVGSSWYVVPVNVQSFTTNFTIQIPQARGGMTFAIQNPPPASSDKSILDVSGGPNILANNQGGFGYSGSTNGSGGTISGLLSSVAVKFDVGSNTTGLYTNGANLSSSQTPITGLSLSSGNPIAVTLTYNGSTLKMTMTDTKTKGSFSDSWSISIPGTVGGSTAYVGFTASTGWNGGAEQELTSWTYSTGSSQPSTVPQAPTNLRVQ